MECLYENNLIEGDLFEYNGANMDPCYFLLKDKILYKKYKALEKSPRFFNIGTCYASLDRCKQVVGSTTYYQFTISYPTCPSIVLYSDKLITATNWVNAINRLLGHEDIKDYYTITSNIGKGAFGMVKKGVSIRTGDTVAIKIIDKLKNRNIIEQIKKEVSIMKLCHHPNIVKLYDVFETLSNISIVMEYIPGGDLLEYFKARKSKLPEDRIRQIIREIANALSYMKDSGIIHRDLKLENILLTDSSDYSNVKIVDFGLSSLQGPNQESLEKFGTLHYTAPEILSGKPYDASVDIWSLGVILYTLICGSFPFEGTDDASEICSIVNKPLSFKSGQCGSQEVISLIRKMLQKDPYIRPTISEVLSNNWVVLHCKPFIDTKSELQCRKTISIW